VKTLIVNW